MENEEVKRVDPLRDRGGQWVRFGGEEYKVAPLNFKSLQELQPELSKIMEAKGASELPVGLLSSCSKLVHAALSRNYPELTLDAVSEMLDMDNFNIAVRAVVSAAGIQEGPPAGETKAQATP